MAEHCDWEVKVEHVRKAIKIAPSTSPGVDGIPFSAWRRLGETGVLLLHSVLKGLVEEDGWARTQKLYANDWGS